MNITAEFLDLFGINTIPTDFPSFITWFCSLVAALLFVRVIFVFIHGLYKELGRMNR